MAVIYFVIYIYIYIYIYFFFFFFLIAKALCISLRSLNFILQVMGKHLIKPVILFIYFGYLFYLAVLGLSCGTWDLSFFFHFWLCLVFAIAPGLFSNCSEQGPFSSCSVRASHHSGLFWSMDSRAHGLQ